MNITEIKLSWFAEIGNQIIDIACEYARIKYNMPHQATISDFNSTSISFMMTYEDGCRGNYETKTFDFSVPFSVLSDPDWKRKLQADIDYQKKQEELAKEQRILRQKEEARERQYQEYLKLKQQFENRDET